MESSAATTMLEGAAAACEAAGLSIPIIGVDGSDEAAALIRDGKATGTALQQFALMAQMAVEQADTYLKDGSTGLDEKQLVDCVAITKDNVANLKTFVYTEDGADTADAETTAETTEKTTEEAAE